MNRLSGDIRLLDRHFYFFSYATIVHFIHIFSSLTFSVVNLGIGWPALTMSLLSFTTFGLASLLFNSFIKLRKKIYVKEAITKGELV